MGLQPTNMERARGAALASPLANQRRRKRRSGATPVVVLGDLGEAVSSLCDDRGLTAISGRAARTSAVKAPDGHRRDHDPSEADKRDPGNLDIVYGRFRFDEGALNRRSRHQVPNFVGCGRRAVVEEA